MILTLVEHDAGTPAETSLEALTFARELAAAGSVDVDTMAFGSEAGELADALGPYGVTRVHHINGEGLDTYAPEAWGESLAQTVRELSPAAVVAPGSGRGHEVLAHAGASLDTPVATNCLDVDVAGDGAYELRRQQWGGSLIEHARLTADTKLVSAAEHEFPVVEADHASDPEVATFTPDLDDDRFRVQVDRIEESDEEGVPLGEARVVVGGGRGVGGDDYSDLEELAELLGGTVGASRAAVNEGWRPHDDQIGQTGAKISPDIYIAAGISGAVQHMVGCKGAETMLAINTDPEAAIMQKADWAVIGDLHEVIPELNDAIRAKS